jgi:predicted acyltransferase
MELRPLMQHVTTAIFLLAYWVIIMLIPVPGRGAVVLEPECNLATWFDQRVPGLFHHGDNTWLLSYPRFASSVLAGVMAGNILRFQKTIILKEVPSNAFCAS